MSAFWLLPAFMLGLALALLVWHYEVRTNNTKVRRRVVVNLQNGTAFSGVLWCKHSDWLVLRNAELLERGGESVHMDGEVVLERRHVEFVQVL